MKIKKSKSTKNKVKLMNKKVEVKEVEAEEEKVKIEEMRLCDLHPKKALGEIAKFEIGYLLKKLAFLSQEHGLVPVIENLKLSFVPKDKHIMEDTQDGRKISNMEHDD